MSKFKIGDKVNVMRRKGNSSGFSPYLNNYYGCIVTGINSTTYTVRDNNNNDYIGLFDDSELELVEENPLQRYMDILPQYFDYALPSDYKPGDIIQVPSKKTFMTNLITTFKNITRSEPNKTFVKAGILTEDLTLTEQGSGLFIHYLFGKHADLFKKDVVDAILAEQEKK